ncbi:MAG: hypothetical protein OXC44_01780 [Proteobacteria bacterium]|nr:hypothetical protein [Pseudomonadota bacterium]
MNKPIILLKRNGATGPWPPVRFPQRHILASVADQHVCLQSHDNKKRKIHNRSVDFEVLLKINQDHKSFFDNLSKKAA